MLSIVCGHKSDFCDAVEQICGPVTVAYESRVRRVDTNKLIEERININCVFGEWEEKKHERLLPLCSTVCLSSFAHTVSNEISFFATHFDQFITCSHLWRPEQRELKKKFVYAPINSTNEQKEQSEGISSGAKFCHLSNLIETNFMHTWNDSIFKCDFFLSISASRRFNPIQS